MEVHFEISLLARLPRSSCLGLVIYPLPSAAEFLFGKVCSRFKVGRTIAKKDDAKQLLTF